MSDLTRYPLCWPDNVARTPPELRTHPAFTDKTIDWATRFLLEEINRLNGHRWDYTDQRVIVSTNLRLRKDGLPVSDQGQPRDTGVAIYFQLEFRQAGKKRERHVVMTCDKWNRVQWNIYAIAKDIEAQRARERWGCGSIEQAFRGYLAIPERCGGASWWITLGVASNATVDLVKAAFKAKAKTAHPDVGGDPAAWRLLQEAFDQAMSVLQK